MYLRQVISICLAIYRKVKPSNSLVIFNFNGELIKTQYPLQYKPNPDIVGDFLKLTRFCETESEGINDTTHSKTHKQAETRNIADSHCTK